MEVIDLGINNLESISLGGNERSSSPSVNFGPGIELLMNDKKRTSSNSVSFDTNDLTELENELNTLSGNVNKRNDESSGGFFSSIFNYGNTNTNNDTTNTNTDTNTSRSVQFEGIPSDSNLGSSTANIQEQTHPLDGFTKISDIPVDFNTNRMSDREKRRKKRMMIKKLEEWAEKGIIKLNSMYNMDSDYDEVLDEYEQAMEDKRKKDSIKLQSWWFITFVNSIEYANTVFNPFDLNLDGWGEQVSEDIDSYEEIFTELYHKYKGGKLSPELSLLLRLGFSAAVVNITNKALSTSAPGFNDIIKQSPELMKMFTNATVQSLSKEQPTANFMSNILNAEPSVNTSFGPPPAPVATKQQPPPPPAQRMSMQYTNRPDIAASRGIMFREEGVELNKNQENIMTPQGGGRSLAPRGASSFTEPTTIRPEMQGPRESLLPPRRQEKPSESVPSIHVDEFPIGDGEIERKRNTTREREYERKRNQDAERRLEEMVEQYDTESVTSSNAPSRKGRGRRRNSDKNVVSLDI